MIINDNKLTKCFVDAFRNEVSGGGVKIVIPELNDFTFYVFAPQPEETAYFYRLGIEELQYNKIYCARLICARARNHDNTPFFGIEEAREATYTDLTTQVPSSWTDKACLRVRDEIENAYPIASVEEAGNESEETASSDSTST